MKHFFSYRFGIALSMCVLFGIMMVTSSAWAVMDVADKALAAPDIKAKAEAHTWASENPVLAEKGCTLEGVTRTYTILGGFQCTDTTIKCPESPIFTSCCVCELRQPNGSVAQTPVTQADDTKDTCVERCNAKGFDVSQNVGAGTFPSPKVKSLFPTLQQQTFVNALCFKSAQCSNPPYNGTFLAGQGCKGAKGKCIAPEPDLVLNIGLGTTLKVKGFSSYVVGLYKFLITFALLAAAIMFVYGGLRYILGSSFADVKTAKKDMINALIGLALTLSAMTILQTVNPMTLNMSKLNVFMINRNEILQNEFCADIVATKNLFFAYAGERPNYTAVRDIKDFEVEQKATRCNYDYYADGFADYKCKGRLCDHTGDACVPCDGGICPKGADPNGFACVAATWFGTITYTASNYATKIMPLAVCNKAITTIRANLTVVDESAKDYMFPLTPRTISLSNGGGSSGIQTYVIMMTPKDVQEAVNDCQKYDGVAGFVLGVMYHDSALTADDFIVAAMGDTGNFSGYADGELLSSDASDVKRALYCAISASNLKADQMFSMKDMNMSLGVDGPAAPIEQSLVFSSDSAPAAPVRLGNKVLNCTGKKQ